jgi:3'-phosphoadenosine 5'-phosphosulfate sulfotransferase
VSKAYAAKVQRMVSNFALGRQLHESLELYMRVHRMDEAEKALYLKATGEEHNYYDEHGVSLAVKREEMGR